ncbi:MAG: YqjF family protein [Actinomycetota bacterium]
MRAQAVSLDDLALSAPERIDRAVMVQRWDRLSFLDRPCDPEVMRSVLPPGLEIDTFHGVAWIGLIAFRLTVRAPALPALPWISRFAEMNVRTYVRGPDGRRGIWFLSLDADRLAAVIVARRWYRIPNVWGTTHLIETPQAVRYESRRRWPGSAGAELRLTVAPPEPIAPSDVTELERFLTCRWRLYSPAPLDLPATRVRFVPTQVEHPRWPLLRANVLKLREGLLAAAGLPGFGREHVAHFSPGVRVRFGPRRPVGSHLGVPAGEF